MLKQKEYDLYRNRIRAPILENDWKIFTKQFSEAKVGDFVFVYAEGIDEIVKISSIDKDSYKFVDSDGIGSDSMYIWTLVRKATKKEIKEKVDQLKKHLNFYEN